ncbi:MAG: SDR family NAD(P)-dependent oxidoreductase [Parahaliea sp.]
MHIDLKGRTAIVTGSTRGIGLATALGLARAGACVVVNGRNDEAVGDTVNSLERSGFPARGVVADVGTVAGCAALIEAERAADILVNNAAFIGWADFFDADDATWEQAWQTNVLSAVRLARHYMPAMGEKGWGRLVFISSETARNVQSDLLPYAASKLALHAVSRGIAKQMAGTGVTANVVLPGPTLSAGARSMLAPVVAAEGLSFEQAGAQFVNEHRSSSLLGRMASEEEVAAMIVFICSPQASATTGAVLRVDGGIVEDIN